MDYTVHRILQAGILEWVTYLFSIGSSQPRNRTGVSCTARESLPTELWGSHVEACNSLKQDSILTSTLRNASVLSVAHQVKNLPAMQETWVRSLGWEYPLEKGKATHSSILAWRILWTVQSMGSQRVGHDERLSLSLLFYFLIPSK